MRTGVFHPRRALWVGLLIGFLVSGCSRPVPAIVVRLPDLAAYRHQEITWDLRWWDGVEIQHRAVGSPSSGAPPRVVVPLSSGGAMLPVVSAVPRVRIGAGIPLAPFGGWPQGEAKDVPLVRERGEIAITLLALAASGLDPALVNVDRLAVLAAAGAGAPGRMRALDTHRLEEALRERSMRVSRVSFRPAPLWVVRTPLEEVPPGGDHWFSDEPGRPHYQGEPAGEYSIFSVPVMATEVRRLWQQREDGGWDVLVVARNAGGNGWQHRFSVSPD